MPSKELNPKNNRGRIRYGRSEEGALPRGTLKEVNADVGKFVGVEGNSPSFQAQKERKCDGKTKVRILLAVWGDTYIKQFLEISLPSFLAPDNIPAIAAEFPCEFVFLTSENDKPYFAENPVFRALSRVCDVSFCPIDHLIVQGNYSTTITLAYASVIQSMGEAMLNTYFVFLVADYVMADGSMCGLLKHMREGRSAVLAGNFQVTHQEVGDYFRQSVDPENHFLAIPPRELMKYSLQHLHGTTVANIVNHPMSHNSHTNRLFWQVDKHTLIGQFFLMHMLCIKPEITNFRIGASCDYSFVPEMCPSGDIAILDDSDDYLVVEHQGYGHEAEFVRPGPISIRPLAASLSEWTTALHRENARHAVMFHARDLPADIAAVKADANEFVEKIFQRLSSRPQPYREHPYWLGAITAFRLEHSHKGKSDQWHLVAPLRFGGGKMLRAWRKVFWAVFGRPPQVRPWHHAWDDYREITRVIVTDLADPAHRMLTISEEPNCFSDWLENYKDRVLGLQTTHFLDRSVSINGEMKGSFDSCFIFLTESELCRASELLNRVGPLLKREAIVHIFIPNGSSYISFHNFAGLVASYAPQFQCTGFKLAACRYSGSETRRVTGAIIRSCYHMLVRHPFLNIALVAALLVPTFLVVALDNLVHWSGQRWQGGYCSSVVVSLVAQ